MEIICGEVIIIFVKMIALKMQLVEHWGSGLKRIRELCAENGVEEPTYTANYSFFTATVKRNSYKGNVPLNTGNVPLNTGNVPLNTGDVPLNTGDVPLNTENVPLNTQVESLSEREQMEIECIVKNPSITAKEISDIIGVNEKTIKRDIIKLKDKNILVREGSKKSGYWKILSDK